MGHDDGALCSIGRGDPARPQPGVRRVARQIRGHRTAEVGTTKAGAVRNFRLTVAESGRTDIRHGRRTESVYLLSFRQTADGGDHGICFPLPPDVRLGAALEAKKRTTGCEPNLASTFNIDVWVVPFGSKQPALEGDGDLKSLPSLARTLRDSWAQASFPMGPGDELAPRSKELGLRYRVPAEVRIFVMGMTGGQSPSVASFADTQVAQLGPIVALPASTGSRTTQFALTPYTDTGGVKELKVVTAGFAQDGAVFEGLAAAAESASKAKASSEGRTEFEKLEAQRKKLDECKQLRALQTELGMELSDCMN